MGNGVSQSVDAGSAGVRVSWIYFTAFSTSWRHPEEMNDQHTHGERRSDLVFRTCVTRYG